MSPHCVKVLDLPAALPLAYYSRRPERSVILEGLLTHLGSQKFGLQPFPSLLLQSQRPLSSPRGGPLAFTLFPCAKVPLFPFLPSGTSRRKSQPAPLRSRRRFPELSALTWVTDLVGSFLRPTVTSDFQC